MNKTGIFVTEEERKQVETAYSVSGMFLSGGIPMGDPYHRVYELSKKYNAPKEAGLNIKTGEFICP